MNIDDFRWKRHTAMLSESTDHAILDRQSRRRKGRKIRDLLERRRPLTNLRILDVGTGSGHAAGVFLDAVSPDGEVFAVDRINQLAELGINFRLTETTELPFKDGSFDVVITNHVIEHVGERKSQSRHLSEIIRVLNADGIVYLAMPNRWAVWEHHFDLPFLAWMPLPVASWLVRVTGKGASYDCRPLSRTDLVGLFSAVGFNFEDITVEALRYFADNEMNPAMGNLIGICPDAFLRLLVPLMPTLVFLGRKQ